MLTKNFPAKKQRRRERAIERLKSGKPETAEIRAEIIRNTEENLVENARAIRTKIDRSVRGKRKR